MHLLNPELKPYKNFSFQFAHYALKLVVVLHALVSKIYTEFSLPLLKLKRLSQEIVLLFYLLYNDTFSSARVMTDQYS